MGPEVLHARVSYAPLPLGRTRPVAPGAAGEAGGRGFLLGGPARAAPAQGIRLAGPPPAPRQRHPDRRESGQPDGGGGTPADHRRLSVEDQGRRRRPRTDFRTGALGPSGIPSPRPSPCQGEGGRRRTHGMKRIGFVGAGTMGIPMIANLLKAGFSVLAYDVRPEAVEEAKKRGAAAAGVSGGGGGGRGVGVRE